MLSGRLDELIFRWGESPRFIEGFIQAIVKKAASGRFYREIPFDSTLVKMVEGGCFEFEIKDTENKIQPPSDLEAYMNECLLQFNIFLSDVLFGPGAKPLSGSYDLFIDSQHIKETDPFPKDESFTQVEIAGTTFLMKEVDIDLSTPFDSREEFFMHNCRHKFIQRCIGHTYSKNGPKVKLFLEDFDQTLSEFLNTPPNRSQKLRILVQVAQGLAIIHMKKFVHNAICPQNIYIKDGSALIGGFSKAEFKKKPNDTNSFHSFDPRLDDIFMFGLLMYFVFTGNNIFGQESFGDQYCTQIMMDRTLTIPDSDTRIQDLFCKMVFDNPDNRPEATEVYKTLEGLI